MFRSNWSKLFAAVGVLAFAGLFYASYYELEHVDQQPYAAYKYQPARDRFAPRPSKDARVTTKAYQPYCDKPQSGNDADLCAQWAAVSAVEENNRLSRTSILITGLEFAALIVSLFFTGWAALAAAKAARIAEEATKDADRAIDIAQQNADAASEQASVAREAMQSDLRAWVGISCAVSAFTPSDTVPCVGLDIVLRNYGRTPAPWAEVSIISFTRTSHATDTRKKRRVFLYHPFEPVMPGETSKEGFALSFDKDQIEEIAAIAEEEGSEVILGFRVVCNYRTVFDGPNDRPRRSSATYTVSPKGGHTETLFGATWYGSPAKPDDLWLWPSFTSLPKLT